MRSRVHKLGVHNFKAFREFNIDLEGRHLLVYGENGAGKSSLYWALYTFLQSARKPKHSIAKYFDPTSPESLLNVHEVDPVGKPGTITMTLRDVSTKADTTLCISLTAHETHDHPAILKGDLASDFVNYRFFFGFSHLRNSEKFDIWPIFEREILPFCVSPTGKIPLEMWASIKEGTPNPSKLKGVAGKKAYEAFRSKTEEFGVVLSEIVDTMSNEAQRVYDRYFADGVTESITLKLSVTVAPKLTGSTQKDSKLQLPTIEFGVQIGNRTVHRPQVFLNEAKLTQLALSVRLAASMVKLRDSDVKLLVLDDLLVSLDMSNRMQVVDALLTDYFSSYQKIILTHDLGFFREFRRRIGASHSDWVFVRLKGDPATNIEGESEKTELQKAEEYLHGHNLEQAATCIRKAAEEIVRRYSESLDLRKHRPGKFVSLANSLREARNKLLESVQGKLYDEVLQDLSLQHRAYLIPTGDADVDILSGLDSAARAKLKAKRSVLRSMLTDDNWKALENVRIIDSVLQATERVLNPSAHAGDDPLYKLEVKKSLELVAKLEAYAS